MGTLRRAAADQDLRHRAHWDALLAVGPPAGALHWVVLGDSAAVGLGVDDISTCYVSVAGRTLAAATGRPVHVSNLAASGATTASTLDTQVPRLVELPAADVLSCAIGGNDVAWPLRWDQGAFERSYAALAGALPNGSAVGLVPAFGHWPYEQRARQANQVVADEARRQGHHVADLHTPTRALGLVGTLRHSSRDRFHPNGAGHALWAEALLPALTAQLVN